MAKMYVFKVLLIYKLTSINKLRSIERWCNSCVVPQVPLWNFLGFWMTIQAEDPCTEDWFFCAIFRCGKAQMWRFLRSWDSNFVESNMIYHDFVFHFGADQLGIFWRYSPWVSLEKTESEVVGAVTWLKSSSQILQDEVLCTTSWTCNVNV